jgi:hypothetical protein
MAIARPFVANPTRYNLALPEIRNERDLLPDRAGMEYHHIIPHSVLRVFWNTCVARNLEQLRETLVPELRRSMGAYPLVRPDEATVTLVRTEVDGFLNQIWMGRYAHDAACPGPPPVPVMMENFRGIYLWLPGNLFVGPRDRDNDPGDGFDSYASRVLERERYLTVLSAYGAIQMYLGQQQGAARTADATGTRAAAQNGKLAHAAGLALARVARYSDMTAYDPRVW